MMELPEAAVIARQITETLTGKRIASAVANASPHKFAWYSGDPAEYNDRLASQVIRGAETGKLSAKAFLATEQRIPGLGNGVLQDILWTARIHPKRKMAELSDQAIDDMYIAVKSVLADMVAKGGRDTERDLFWQPGGYRTVLSRNTVDTPCPACGTTIRKEAYSGGAIYVCETCQPL